MLHELLSSKSCFNSPYSNVISTLTRFKLFSHFQLGGDDFPDLYALNKKELFYEVAEFLKQKLDVDMDYKDVYDIRHFKGKTNGVRITFSNKRPGM